MALDQEQIHQVAALSAAGKSVRAIESLTGVPKSVVHRTITGDEAGRLISDLRPRIAAHLSEKMLEMVTAEDFKPKPQELAIIWGIAMDKHQRATQPDQSHSNFYQLVQAQVAVLNPPPVEPVSP